MWITQSSAERFASMYHLSLKKLFESAQSRDFVPRRIPVRMTLSLQFETRYFSGTNMIGILEGNTYPNECVVVSSHHDHLGMDPSASGDKIFNGAEDNASGISALLTIMNTLASKGPFRRSICFVSLTAEENGLLGAFYYVSHPIMKMVADINFDIVNLYGSTRDIVGLGAEMSELKYALIDAASKENLYVSEDPNPASGSFFRSDTFAFAMAGVPSIYIWSGADFIGQPNDYFQKMRDHYVNNRYHQPSDEYNSSWSMGGVMQQVRVALRICYGLANSQSKPLWLKGQNEGLQLRS